MLTDGQIRVLEEYCSGSPLSAQGGAQDRRKRAVQALLDERKAMQAELSSLKSELQQETDRCVEHRTRIVGLEAEVLRWKGSFELSLKERRKLIDRIKEAGLPQRMYYLQSGDSEPPTANVLTEANGFTGELPAIDGANASGQNDPMGAAERDET